MRKLRGADADLGRKVIEELSGIDPEPFIGTDKDGEYVDLNSSVGRLAMLRARIAREEERQQNGAEGT